MFQTAPMANERNGKSTAMCHTLSANAGGKLGQTFADWLTFLSDAWPGQLLATDSSLQLLQLGETQLKKKTKFKFKSSSWSNKPGSGPKWVIHHNHGSFAVELCRNQDHQGHQEGE